VRGTAASTYSAEVIDDWAPATISPERVQAFARSIERGEQIAVVAEDGAGRIVGFGSIVPKNSELRALYVSAEHGRQGIGRALLCELEALARGAGVTELRMIASVNAAPFYEGQGFVSIERDEHTLPSGVRMACVRMRKTV
jgi:putative acetyltransferase